MVIIKKKQTSFWGEVCILLKRYSRCLSEVLVHRSKFLYITPMMVTMMMTVVVVVMMMVMIWRWRWEAHKNIMYCTHYSTRWRHHNHWSEDNRCFNKSFHNCIYKGLNISIIFRLYCTIFLEFCLVFYVHFLKKNSKKIKKMLFFIKKIKNNYYVNKWLY